VQFHFVKLHEVEAAMRRLAEAGLTTREACGNSVRNVTVCFFAGVSADEVFDTTPYAEALTRHFLRHPLSSTLPRKFKIGFEGCATDHVLSAINDIGWRAGSTTGAGVSGSPWEGVFRSSAAPGSSSTSSFLWARCSSRRKPCCASSTGSATTSTSSATA
jgi:hypothetical protein